MGPDVRPEDEFQLGRLLRALSELEHRLAESPRGANVAAYCRGPYCVLSFEAVLLLRARGHVERRLADGFPERKTAGLPVETSAP